MIEYIFLLIIHFKIDIVYETGYNQAGLSHRNGEKKYEKNW